MLQIGLALIASCLPTFNTILTSPFIKAVQRGFGSIQTVTTRGDARGQGTSDGAHKTSDNENTFAVEHGDNGQLEAGGNNGHAGATVIPLSTLGEASIANKNHENGRANSSSA